VSWKHIVLFFGILGIYVICIQPDWSWAGYDCDAGDFWNTALYAQLSHFPGNPLFSMISWLAVRIPLGTEGWRLAFFLSTIPAVLICVIVFYVVKKQTEHRWAPYIGCLSVAGANIFLMQSVVVETYVFSALVAVSAYALIVHKRYTLAAIATGLMTGVHPFTLFVLIAIIVWSKEVRRRWRLWIPAAVLPYIWVITLGLTRPSFSVFTSTGGGMFQYGVGSLQENAQYWGSLALSDIPQKVVMIVVVFVGAFGLCLIPMAYAVNRKYAVVVAAAAVPVVYYMGNMMDLTVHHLALAVPFLGILAGLGMDRVRSLPAGLIVAPSLIFLVLLPFHYDLGNNLDENLSGAQFYRSLDDIEDGSIIMTLNIYKDGMFFSGRENTFVLIYNKNTGRSLIPVTQSYFSDQSLLGYESVGQKYRQDLLDKYGIDTPWTYDEDKERQENMWDNMVILKAANPDHHVYYIRIPEENTLNRILEEYYDR